MNSLCPGDDSYDILNSPKIIDTFPDGFKHPPVLVLLFGARNVRAEMPLPTARVERRIGDIARGTKGRRKLKQ